jgi:hypothetical protein
VPWQFGFQMNERHLEWGDAAHAQLVRAVLGDKLGLVRAGEM